MAPPDVYLLLDQLADLQQAEHAMLRRQQTALPAKLRARFACLHGQYAPALAALAQEIVQAERAITAAVIFAGTSVVGGRLHAVYVPGKSLWDGRALDAYALDHGELLQFCARGAPRVYIRTRDRRIP